MSPPSERSERRWFTFHVINGNLKLLPVGGVVHRRLAMLLPYVEQTAHDPLFAKAVRRGSQRWMQWFVNHAPHVLDEQIGLGPIDWRSPLREDDYAEYRDAAFLERIGVTLGQRPLESFWPRGGPQWDALGRAASGEAVIVEAKAHLNELYSPASGASDPSLALIQASLT